MGIVRRVRFTLMILRSSEGAGWMSVEIRGVTSDFFGHVKKMNRLYWVDLMLLSRLCLNAACTENKDVL